MAEQILKTIFQIKRGQSAAWASVNPVLRPGEPGFELDTNKLKIGNGVDAYNDLPYLTDAEIARIEGLEASLSLKANIADVYTKSEIDGLISGIYSYKGTVKSFADLPTEGLKSGDVYNIETADEAHGITAGDNVAWNGESWDKLAGFIDLSKYATIEDLATLEVGISKDEVKKSYKEIKYEVKKPNDKVLVDYRDKEIRIMFPEDMEWTLQNVGAEGNSNMYYFEFRAYAPEGAVSFKEDDKTVIEDVTMYYFEGNKFAGIDEFGRKFSRMYLAAAVNDGTEWTYFGKNSNSDKYIGWYYTVEWYNADGDKMSTDQIRINLSNESCHHDIQPFYMNEVVKTIIVNGKALEMKNNEVRIPIAIPVSSEEDNHVSINEDGSMEINNISIDKIVQPEGSEPIVYDGGEI